MADRLNYDFDTERFTDRDHPLIHSCRLSSGGAPEGSYSSGS